MRSLLVAVIVVCAPWPVMAQDRYFAPTNVLRFADALVEEKDFIRAAVEYQRYLAMVDGAGADVAQIHFKIALCFRQAHEYEKALTAFRDVVARFPETAWAVQAHVQVAYTLFLAGRHEESTQAVEPTPMSAGPDEVAILTSIKGANLMFERRWDAADRYFKALVEQRPGDRVVADMAALAAEGARQPRKSAVAAGLMSAILPGTGRWYAGRRADGVLSLITFVTTGWQAYRGFDKNGVRSTRGWIYGSLAGFLYVGNIYGSVVAVRINNDAAESSLLRRAEMSISVSFR